MKTKPVYNHEGFKLICKTTQKNLHTYLTSAFTKANPETVSNSDFIYVPGDENIMFVAHLDTVHTEIPSDIFYDKDAGVVWSPQGIGGDDRCGVYMLLNIYANAKTKPHLLFTCDEEKGCLGAKQVNNKIKKKLSNIKFMVEFDRQGSQDSCYYDTDNKEFEEFINKHGFVTEKGIGSDIKYISPDLDIASVNLSCGNYMQHTKTEYVKVNEMMSNVEKALKILESSKAEKKFKFGGNANKANSKVLNKGKWEYNSATGGWDYY